jgi:hypothetical protein
MEKANSRMGKAFSISSDIGVIVVTTYSRSLPESTRRMLLTLETKRQIKHPIIIKKTTSLDFLSSRNRRRASGTTMQMKRITARLSIFPRLSPIQE